MNLHQAAKGLLILILAGAVARAGVPPAESPQTSSAGQNPAPAQPAASNTDQRLQQLQQKIEDLEQQLRALEEQEQLRRIEDAAAAEKARQAATVTADTSGFTIVSPHGNFLLKIGADLQADSRTFVGENSVNPMDTMVLRRVRPTFSGTVYKYIDYFFRPDFGLGTTIIYDAYVELKYFDWGRVRVGKFKPPVGLERLQSDDDTTFVERGFPTLLVPSRDIGYQLSGDLIPRHVTYAVGVFNGVPDNGLSDASVTDQRDYAWRVFFNPLNPEIANLGFGIAGSTGNTDNEPLPSYRTFGQNQFITFAPAVTEGGHRDRLTPSGYYYMGPFGLLWEYAAAAEGLQKAGARHTIALRAWQVAGSYILTGERKSFANPTPRKNFDPRNGGWGAVEIALRTGGFSADQGLFDYGYASSTNCPRSAREVVGGVNWYLNRLMRISLDYGHTSFTGGAIPARGGNRPAENAFILRFQINFI